MKVIRLLVAFPRSHTPLTMDKDHIVVNALSVQGLRETNEIPHKFVMNPTVPKPHDPWEIRMVFMDLDGTLVDTYKALGAFAAFARCASALLGSRDFENTLVSLATYVRKYASVERALHHPEGTLKTIARLFAHHEGVALPRSGEEGSPFQDQDIQSLLEGSFKVFPGVIDFLQTAKETGTVCHIYTNTNPRNAVQRLIRAGITPDLIGDIWTKAKSSEEIHNWPADSLEQAYLQKLRPYKDAKPNPTPILTGAAEYGIAPEHTLMIGEGIADLGSVLEDPTCLNASSRLYTRFAFQEEGARVTGEHNGFNGHLRKNHPLGLDCFRDKYPLVGEHSGVVTLPDGFLTLNTMIQDGTIKLSPTGVTPLSTEQHWTRETPPRPIREPCVFEPPTREHT